MSHSIFYIDDSGTKEYAKNITEYSTSGNSRYFCFGGLLLSNIESANLGHIIARHKLKYFGTSDVEIKSNWIRRPKERNEKYIEKYGIPEAELAQFVEELYDILSESDIMLCAAIVDKIHMQEDYGIHAWYAPTIAYEILMQRAVQEIISPNIFSVMIDDITGKTPKGNEYKRNLRKHHQALRKEGSKLLRSVRKLDFSTMEGQKFVNSAKSHLIQIADIVAYNVYRQFVEHGEDWEDRANKRLPVYSWLNKLSNKFRNHYGRIQGYGIIKMPLRTRRKWHTREKRVAPYDPR